MVCFDPDLVTYHLSITKDKSDWVGWRTRLRVHRWRPSSGDENSREVGGATVAPLCLLERWTFNSWG